MKKIKKEALLKWSLFPAVLSLAWPTMLEQLMQTLIQYIDTAMVGSLGTTATAAVGSTTTLNWLISGTISAIGVAFLSYISRANGAGRKDDMKKAAAQAVLSVLICGTLLTIPVLSLSGVIPTWMQVEESTRSLASAYFFILYTSTLPRTAMIVFGSLLRGAGDTKTPMLAGIWVNVTNVVLNFFLIYPSATISLGNFDFLLPRAGIGVIGAAIASAVSFAVGGVYITVALWHHPLLSPKGYSLRPDKAILAPCVKIAIPNVLQRITTSMGYVVFAAMINSLGDIATAAHTIANTVESAFYIPGYGMQSAAATLVGTAYGESDAKKMRALSRLLFFLEIGMMAVSGALLFAFAPHMIRLFSKDAAVILLGATVLRMVALSEPFFGISIVLEGIMQGMGKTAMPFIFNVVGMWVIRIGGTLLCIQWLQLGLVAAWGCMILHNLLLCAMFFVYYKTGKWNPLLKKAGESA